jgi:hypothetical protein
MKRVLPLTVCLLLLGVPATRAEAQAQSDDPGVEWIHVSHREFPLSFDLPAAATFQRAGDFSLARARTDAKERVQVDIFGVRPLPRRLAAVQFGFYWVTADYDGVDADTMRQVQGSIGQPVMVASFLRSVFFQRMDVRLEDRGRRFIDGHLARHTAAFLTVAAGTPDERTIEGEIVLVPISKQTALVAIVRFDPEATDDERTLFFPHVLDSLRIGESGEGSRQTRLSSH